MPAFTGTRSVLELDQSLVKETTANNEGVDLSEVVSCNELPVLIDLVATSREDVAELKAMNQHLRRDVGGLHHTVVRLVKKLGDLDCEKANEKLAFHADIYELHTNMDGLQASLDETKAHAKSLKTTIGCSSQRFDKQARMNEDLTNRLDSFEVVATANHPPHVVNKAPFVHNQHPNAATAAPPTPLPLRHPPDQAGYIPPDHQVLPAYGTPYALQLTAQVLALAGQVDLLVPGI